MSDLPRRASYGDGPPTDPGKAAGMLPGEEAGAAAAERWLTHPVQEVEAGRQVRDVLLRTLRLSRQMVRRLAVGGGIRLNGASPFLSSPVRPGDLLEVRLDAVRRSGLRPVAMELEVVVEDGDVLVVNKPAGLLVHPTRRSHVRTLAHGVLAHLLREGATPSIHPVHRLDRDTSGLVLFAKHPVAHQRLDRQLRSRTLKRGYLAVVQGSVADDEGEIDAPLRRHADDAHLREISPEGGSAARTRFRVVERLGSATLVEVELETGRTHQIRVHMAHAGHPLVGDAAYGGAVGPAFSRQALHAWRLGLSHPLTGTPIRCEVALPADMDLLVRELRGSAGA